ncbi:MAG: hypothetical protein ABI769_04020 [Pseudomonadota bacterium]
MVSETKQTFVATIYIAARDFIDSPIYLKQVQFLSADGDKASMDTRDAQAKVAGFLLLAVGIGIMLRRINALRRIAGA